MIAYLFQGVQIGLGLALLVGPLIILLIQISLEEGTLSSLVAAMGIWFSDLLYVLATYFGLGQLQSFIDHPSFEEIVGTVGGVILLLTGLAMWYKRPPRFGREVHIRPARLGRSFLRGFVINTFNPFPVFFWSAVSVGIVFEDRLNNTETIALYGGILGMVVLTDTLKVLAARKLRQKLTPKAARIAQRVGAFALMVFGLVLFVRVWI